MSSIYQILFCYPTGQPGTNTDPWNADHPLMKHLRLLVFASQAQAARTAYATGMREFSRFCNTHGAPALPASRSTLPHFVAHLSLKGLSPNTINSYLAAMRMKHRQLGLPDPGHRNHTLTLAKCGAARAHCRPQQLREPITHGILQQLLRILKTHRDIPHQDRQMLRAAFCLTYHGFLWVSEYTVPAAGAFDPRQHATHQDIRWHKRWFAFTIKYSKTDHLWRSTEIHLKQTSRSTCPHTTMKRYLQECQGAPTATPLLTFKDDTPSPPHPAATTCTN